MLSFQNFDFKWPVHIIDAYAQVHVIHTWYSYCFTFEVNDSRLWVLQILTMLPQIWLYVYWNKFAMRSTIQMRAVIM